MADVSGNDLNVSEDSSLNDLSSEDIENEIQSELLVTSDYPMPYDYSSDFQTIFTLLSLLIGIVIGYFCLNSFLKGFK